MNTKGKLLGYYNYTVILTYIGMLFGFTGITLIIDGQYHHAVLCLLLAGLCDMFDGTVAATKKREPAEKKFGIQIDSMSDIICFGVFPSMFVYCVNERSDVAFSVSGLYLLCALIRLSYFNVDEEERQSKTSEGRQFYLGMPVTMSALIIPAYFELCSFTNSSLKLSGIIILVLMAFAFLIPFKFRKPRSIEKYLLAVCGGIEFLVLFIGGM